MRLFDLILALTSIVVAVGTIVTQSYFDMPALLVVIGGVAGYALLKGDRSQFMFHLEQGLFILAGSDS